MGFSNDPISSIIEPSLTTLEQPVREIGKQAAHLLLHQINADVSEWKPVHQVLKTHLIVRESSRKEKVTNEPA